MYFTQQMVTIFGLNSVMENMDNANVVKNDDEAEVYENVNGGIMSMVAWRVVIRNQYGGGKMWL